MRKRDDHSRSVVTEVDEYLNRMRRLKFSDKTVKAHRNALVKFVSFLAGKRFQDVTRDDLEAYHAGLVVEDLSSHTVELYLRVVRKFFADLDSRSLIFVNPAAGLVISKPERKLGWTLSDAVVRSVLAVPDLTMPTGLRDRSMLELLYAAGLRIGELAGLNVHDVDIANQTVRVLGKGRKERVLPIGKHAVRHLRDYVKHGRPKLLKEGIDEPALWLSIKTGKRLQLDGIMLMVRRTGRQAGQTQPLTCHVFRRSCATAMLRNGAHPEMVRNMLGHSSMKSLAQYLRVTINDIRKMHEQSKPGR